MVAKARKRTTDLTLVPKVESGIKDFEKSMRDLVELAARLTTKSLYFGLGASVLLKESFEDFVDKAVRKGEDSGTELLKTIKSAVRVEQKQKKVGTAFEARIEPGVRKVLDTLDIPSKSDIEKLSRRVAELSRRINKMTRTQK